MILFLCDKEACENCRSENKECIYTSDIRHAVNFKKVNGHYTEKAKDSFTELVKELNILLDKYFNLRTLRFSPFADFEEPKKQVDEICKGIENAIGTIVKKIYEVK